MALSIQRVISKHHSPNVLPVGALEEGVVRDLLHCLPNPVLRVTEEAVDEVLCLGGDRRELGGEDEVLAPVHDLVVCLCRRDGRGLRGGGGGGGEGRGRGRGRGGRNLDLRTSYAMHV